MVGGLFKKEKSIEEIEEETEKLDAEDQRVGKELSITQKKVAIARLKEKGLTPRHFSFQWDRIIQWLKTH